MEAGVRCGAATGIEASAIARRVEGGRLRLRICGGVRFSSGFSARFQGIVKFSGGKGKCIAISSAESNKCDSRRVSTPLVPESPAGKFLSGILNDHPHIFPAAAAEQLESLASERDGAIARRNHSEGSPQACLHARIAQMKEDECQTAVEEVMYMLIAHRFSQIKVSLYPNLSWDSCPSYEEELQSIYDRETLDMVKIHLLNILARMNSINEIDRLQLGRIYAASIMYGYFLKSAILRHHLEYLFSLSTKDYPLSYLIRMPSAEDDAAYPSYSKMKPRRIKNLKSYIMKFDSTVLQMCARLKSQEAVNLIEKHSRALFLDKVEKNNVKDEPISLAYLSLKHLVLEAVTFGSFLWDVERYVDSVYSLSDHS